MMLMQSGNFPGSSQNPYDFITNAPTKKKRSLLPGSGSKNSRLIVVAVGAVVLLFLAILIISLLNSGSAAIKNDYVKLAQQQTELIRVSQLGTTKAQKSETKNLAITTQLSLASQQNDILALAEKAGANTDPKNLALGKNAATDELLTAAEQSNRFDAVFSETLVKELQDYQKLLKSIYEASESSSTKDTLSKAYNAVDDLLGSVATDS